MTEFICKDCGRKTEYDFNYRCNDCSGIMIVDDGENECPHCDGLGIVDINNFNDGSEVCPECNGEGII